MAAKVKTFDAEGQKWDIFASSEGDFYVELPNHEGIVKADTLKKLEKKLIAMKRENRVNIPVTLIKLPSWHNSNKPIEFTQGSLTGIHARTHNLLFKGDDGTNDQLGSYDGQICRRLSEGDINHVLALFEAYKDAEQTWEAHLESLKVSGERLVREAAGTEE